MEWVGQWWRACLQMTLCRLQKSKNFRVVDEFYNICTRRKLKVYTGKSEVKIFKRREVEMVNFNTLYRVSVPTA